MLKTTKIEYVHENVVLEAYCAMDSNQSHKKPAVLVAHDWSGRNEFACKKAEQLAELGYIGFALDMYGQAQTANTTEEKKALMMPLMEDRSLLRHRVMAAFETVKTLEAVDTARIAAIGFCFGGGCVLDLARAGAAVKGVVSFHGLLNAPASLPNKKILAKVIAFQGHEDPMCPPEQVAAFQKEMTDSGVDWQMLIFGNTMHAFTNPTAHDPSSGLVYKASAEQRSWIAMKNFLHEIFAS